MSKRLDHNHLDRTGENYDTIYSINLNSPTPLSVRHE